MLVFYKIGIFDCFCDLASNSSTVCQSRDKDRLIYLHVLSMRLFVINHGFWRQKYDHSQYNLGGVSNFWVPWFPHLYK